MKATLDKSERAIEDAAASFRPVSGKKCKTIESILARSRNRRRTRIRVAGGVAKK